MEQDEYVPVEAKHYYFNRMMYASPDQIVEIEDDNISKSFINVANKTSIDGGACDVYVAVGRDDLHVVKWALDHAVSPGARVFLIHVFPTLTYIPTPVGKLARSQLSQEQVRIYINEENNRRKCLLEKYISLCNDANVPVETMLLESNVMTKAILDLIPVLNITQLVIGTKSLPSSRRSMKKMAKGQVVKKNAPDSCEVTIVHDGKKVMECQEVTEMVAESPRKSGNRFFECGCFTGKSVA